MWLKTKVKAFSLLECLVALLVIAGSMTVYQSMTKLTTHQVSLLADSRQEDWLLFCQQLRQELSGARLIKVENNRLYVIKDKKDLAFGKSRQDDFRKTNASGKGYQPMLYRLSSAQMTEVEGLVRIDLVFDNGLERSFVYAFDEKG